MTTPNIYTLSLHDALPILSISCFMSASLTRVAGRKQYICEQPSMDNIGQQLGLDRTSTIEHRSEEHTSELQSHSDLVCRLLLEKKNFKIMYSMTLKRFFLL